jgi:flagellar L-ring protein precursor FlgH
MAGLLDEPELSPIGAEWKRVPPAIAPAAEVAEERESSWIGGPADYFRDARAHKPGDLVTIVIDIDDKASFNSSVNNNRKSSAEADIGFDVNLFSLLGFGEGTASLDSKSATSGQGATSRSEKLSVSVAAIVRETLHNGNLYIEGYQEVMVNNELRKLKVEGIVDPRDIAPGNTVGYSKIAQARISYGSEGQANASIRKGWGLQLWDKIRPF